LNLELRRLKKKLKAKEQAQMETRALAKKQSKDRDGSFLLLLQVINHQRITSLIKKYREYPSQCRIREKTLCLVWDKPWRGRGLQEKQGSQA